MIDNKYDPPYSTHQSVMVNKFNVSDTSCHFDVAPLDISLLLAVVKCCVQKSSSRRRPPYMTFHHSLLSPRTNGAVAAAKCRNEYIVFGKSN